MAKKNTIKTKVIIWRVLMCTLLLLGLIFGVAALYVTDHSLLCTQMGVFFVGACAVVFIIGDAFSQGKAKEVSLLEEEENKTRTNITKIQDE